MSSLIKKSYSKTKVQTLKKLAPVLKWLCIGQHSLVKINYVSFTMYATKISLSYYLDYQKKAN